jgi:hypothetical protein
MPISKPPPQTVDAVIDRAEDAKRARWQRGAKTQITFSVDPDLLDRINAAARRRHINRAALLSLWATEKLAEEPPG